VWPFRRRTEDREALTLEQVLGRDTAETRSGVRVDPDQALRLSACWACRRLLADTISTLPVDAFRAGSRQPVEPKPNILVTPAADTPIDEWLDQVVMSATGGGNAFGLVVARAGAAMRPTQIELLDPARVIPVVRPDRTVEWRLDGREIDTADLWHFRRYPIAGRPLGLSPIGYHAEAVGLGLAAQNYGAEYFGDAATPSGIITSDEVVSQEQANYMYERWMAMKRGRKGIAILGSGAKFEPIAIAPEESQFIASQEFSVQQIARIYGIAPELIGANSGNSMTYANVEQRDISVLRYSINPWLRRLETRLSMLLPRGMFAKFNAGALLRTDLKTRYESYTLALAGGWLTLDEIRELEDREPLPANARRPLEAVA
jgi:HK97 family phage portal protein